MYIIFFECIDHKNKNSLTRSSCCIFTVNLRLIPGVSVALYLSNDGTRALIGPLALHSSRMLYDMNIVHVLVPELFGQLRTVRPADFRINTDTTS